MIHVLKHGQTMRIHGVSEERGSFALLSYDQDHGLTLKSFDTEELMEAHLHELKH